MTSGRTCESPTWEASGGAFVRLGSGLTRFLRRGGSVFGVCPVTEHRTPEESPEYRAAFPVGIHGRISVQLEFLDYLHENIPGRQPLSVLQIGRIRICDANTGSKILIRQLSSSSHVVSMSHG